MTRIVIKTGVIALVVLLSCIDSTFAQNTGTPPAPTAEQIAAQKAAEELLTKYSPYYHFYPSIDPTGLFYYGDKYYLNWGSAVSDDIVHWKITDFGLARNRRSIGGGPATTPGPPQVIGGISGSVVIDWNNTSGFGKNGKPPLVAMQFSNNNTNIAYSLDTAKTWIRHDKPGVMPPGSTGSWRDPKVIWFEAEKKWIMIMPWCEIQEIRFFSSKNLIDWEYMSKFGPWGAVDGQWECVEFFPLPLDGDKSKIKWVLEISVQPRTGVYFVGDFDGKRFTMDPSFTKDLSYKKFFPEGEMLFDFERGLDDWAIEGKAFSDNPTTADGSNGKEGKRLIKSAGVGTGKMTSPEFAITKKYINFLIGGGYYPKEEMLNLLVDGKVVRTKTGTGGNAHLDWAGWDVSEFQGKKARIEIVDNMSGSGMLQKGYIYCDAIMLADDLPKTPYEEHNPGWEKAFWVDWGLDFYAVRAWANLKPGDDRTIWAGWMGSWKYYNEPVRGNFSVPRSLELKTFPEGMRLVQTPIKELESLRTTHKVGGENTFEGAWVPKKFLPLKNSYELIVEFENISAEEFGLRLAIGGNEKTVVGYSTITEEVYVDRRNSGFDDFSGVFPGVSRGPLKNRSNTVKLHIFVDKVSIEVFGNNGEMVTSNKFYPDVNSIGIELFSTKGKVKVKSLDLWDLSPVDIYEAPNINASKK